eukprot:768810-Hanusia_phi.AAC.14
MEGRKEAECLVWMLRMLVPASREQEGDVGKEIVREAIVQHCSVRSSWEEGAEKQRGLRK